jgi:hypothetical protein
MLNHKPIFDPATFAQLNAIKKKGEFNELTLLFNHDLASFTKK